MRARGYRTPRWFVDLPGAVVGGLSERLIDGIYSLVHVRPTYSVGVAPLSGDPHPRLDEIVFYANCLAFEFEVPTFVWNVGTLVVPVERNSGAYEKEAYRSNMLTAYEALTEIRFGLLAHVKPPVSEPDGTVNLPYTARYGGMANEIRLYASAIRQLDPLGEFLCYYRIIERVPGGDHKGWIASNLGRLAGHDFGFLELGHAMRAPDRRRNLFSAYKGRALGRLRQLRASLSEGQIADYLYRQVRCGIAHGKRDLKVYDFAEDVSEVARDCYILKLLSRMAIEEKHKTHHLLD